MAFRLCGSGGQVGHACGLRELGVCSNEVWELTATLAEPLSASVQWTPEPVGRLPFAP